MRQPAVLAALILAAVLLACSGGFPDEFEAPDFTLEAPLSGNDVTLYDLKGKPVIIYWFASW
jgi:hypothetical protein